MLEGCLSEVELYQVYRGELAESDTCTALHHVLTCPLCHEQWNRFVVDAQVAEGIRSSVQGNLTAADDVPGVAAAVELPEQIEIPGFSLRGDFIDGGQARVYHAVHEASREEVAIKVFHNSPLNEGGNARFTRELRSLARLRHPHVVPIRSAGSIQGHAYLVMPWIEGQPLDAYLRSYAGPLARRLNLFGKLCVAVDHAHKRGVMHLDLKPNNVRVEASGEPVVLDFGLARLVTTDPEDPESFAFSVAGTPAYMAPEQAAPGGEVDTRADVFTLGLLLYEILTSRRARPGNSAADDAGSRPQLELAARPVPDVRIHRPRTARDLAAIVARATAADPAHRYQTVEALADDIASFQAYQPVSAMGMGFLYRVSKFSRRHLAFLAGVVAICMIMLLALAVRRETQRYATIAFERHAQTDSAALQGTLQQLGRVYAQLAEAYLAAGDEARAEEYRIRSEAALRRAQSEEERDRTAGGLP